MSLLVNDYDSIIKDLKEKIRSARQRAVLKVNAELLLVYWQIGNIIQEQQNEEGWGAKVIDRLAADLRSEFPDMKGFSVRNLKYMRAFAAAYPTFHFVQQTAAQSENLKEIPIVQQLAAQIPWGHHQVLLDKLKTKEERSFYIQKAAEGGWSRDVMILQIENNLFSRQGKAITNFGSTLTAFDSDLAKATFKSPYVFDFLALSEVAKEKDLEKALILHLKKFMLELGKGFAYVGNQHNLTVDGDDYFLDLLFYNTHLHCYVIFELKIGEFKPEFAGKLNFYINTVNEEIKTPLDQPTIGVLLCKTPNETVVKYSLQGIATPIGVAEYVLQNALPKELKGEIPTIEELEKELEQESERLENPVDKKLKRMKDLLKEVKAEGMQEKKSPEKTMLIFHNFLLRLKKEIIAELKVEIIPLFDSYKCIIRTGSDGNKTNDDAEKYLIEHPNEYDLGLEFTLNGFKPAGINAFQCSAGLTIYLRDYNYTVSQNSQSHNALLIKLYHQLPDEKDFRHVVDKIKEEILDKINAQLERIQEIK